MSIETFDDFNESEYSHQELPNKPFQFREEKSEEGTLIWLRNNFDNAYDRARSRLERYAKWNYLYKGIHWRTSFMRTKDREGEIEYDEKKPKMVDNFIWEFIDAKVSAMARMGTSFVAIPWNNEQNDVNNAKACELLLKARSIEIDLDGLHSDLDNLTYKYGTSFMYIYWDKDKGDLAPEIQKIADIYGGTIPTKIAKKLKRKDLKIGDVCVKPIPPYRVFAEADKKSWDTVNHIDIIEWINIDELRAEYPKKKELLVPNKRLKYDYETNEVSLPEHMIAKITFWHPPTKFFPEGAKIIYTDECILEWTEYPYNHKKLPIVEDRDIKIDEELWGRPKISNIEQKQRQYNNIDSSVARDLGIGSAPKWVYSKGSVNQLDFTNDFSLMEFKGPIAPKLQANNPVSEQALMVQDRLESRMGKLMKVYDISRGNVPQGITANAALRFLDEQESQSNASDEKRRKTRVIKVYNMMLQLMAQYYNEADGRTARILGQNNEYMIESVKKADFSRVYDIQLQNTSALPDTKTGKIAAIVDLNAATQKDPIFNKTETIKMLNLGMANQFVDLATASANTAKTQFDRMLRKEQVEEPQMYDDLLTHYSTFFLEIQNYGFRSRVDDDTKATIYQRIKTIEGLLWVKSQSSPKLMQELQLLSYYPSFFSVPIPPMPAEYTGAGVLEEANTKKMDNTNKAVEADIERQNENK